MEQQTEIKTYKSLNKINVDKIKSRKKIWVGSYGFLSLVFFAAYFGLKLHVFALFGQYLETLQKISLCTAFALIILMAAKFTEIILVRKSDSPATHYNIIRLVRLLTVLLIIMVIVSFLFRNWYTAAVSLGLISLILGFALQIPISSFIGWVYIVLRKPYRVGDRIQVETFTGDVVEINYLDTTLWEFGGEYLTNDIPSGRLIRFPNSVVFVSAVYNYSWDKFPYIWNEIPFHVAYGTDFQFVETVLKRITKNELGQEMEMHIDVFKKLVKQTAVDELDIKEYPYVSFRTNANTWVEATITYLVEPKQATAIRTNLIKKIVAELLKEPEKVLFPQGSNR